MNKQVIPFIKYIKKNYRYGYLCTLPKACITVQRERLDNCLYPTRGLVVTAFDS